MDPCISIQHKPKIKRSTDHEKDMFFRMDDFFGNGLDGVPGRFPALRCGQNATGGHDEKGERDDEGA
jgi:hypothetical protein